MPLFVMFFLLFCFVLIFVLYRTINSRTSVGRARRKLHKSRIGGGKEKIKRMRERKL